MSFTPEIAPAPELDRYLPHGLRRVHSVAMGISKNDIDASWTSKECLQLFTQYGWKTLSFASILDQLHGSVISSDGRDHLSYATRRTGRSDLWLVEGTVVSKFNKSLQKKIHVLSRKGGGSFLLDQLRQKPFGDRESLGTFKSDPVGSVYQSEATTDSFNSEQMFQDGFRTRIILSTSPLPTIVSKQARQYGTHSVQYRENDPLASQVGGQSYIFTMADLYDALCLAHTRHSTLLLRCVIADYLAHSASDDSPHIRHERDRLRELNIDVPDSSDLFSVFHALKSVPLSHQGLIVLSILRSHINIWNDHAVLFREQEYVHRNMHAQNITIGGELTDTVTKRDTCAPAEHNFDDFIVHSETLIMLQEAAAVWYKLMAQSTSPFYIELTDLYQSVQTKTNLLQERT